MRTIRPSSSSVTLIWHDSREFGRTSVTFDQVVFSEGICVASAQSVSVLIDEKTRKPAALTEEIIARFQPWLRKGMKRA